MDFMFFLSQAPWWSLTASQSVVFEPASGDFDNNYLDRYTSYAFTKRASSIGT